MKNKTYSDLTFLECFCSKYADVKRLLHLGEVRVVRNMLRDFDSGYDGITSYENIHPESHSTYQVAKGFLDRLIQMPANTFGIKNGLVDGVIGRIDEEVSKLSELLENRVDSV